MNDRDSPYRSAPIAEPSGNNQKILRHLRLATIPTILLLSTGYVFLTRPNLETYLNHSWPWNSRPDAFMHINNAILPFMTLSTCTSAIGAWVLATHRKSLTIPLTAGPLICAIGWSITDDYQDPTWFHLFALMTIGMLVSCVVTIVLAPLVRSTEPSVARALPKSRF